MTPTPVPEYPTQTSLLMIPSLTSARNAPTRLPPYHDTDHNIEGSIDLFTPIRANFVGPLHDSPHSSHLVHNPHNGNKTDYERDIGVQSIENPSIRRPIEYRCLGLPGYPNLPKHFHVPNSPGHLIILNTCPCHKSSTADGSHTIGRPSILPHRFNWLDHRSDLGRSVNFCGTCNVVNSPERATDVTSKPPTAKLQTTHTRTRETREVEPRFVRPRPLCPPRLNSGPSNLRSLTDNVAAQVQPALSTKEVGEIMAKLQAALDPGPDHDKDGLDELRFLHEWYREEGHSIFTDQIGKSDSKSDIRSKSGTTGSLKRADKSSRDFTAKIDESDWSDDAVSPDNYDSQLRYLRHTSADFDELKKSGASIVDHGPNIVDKISATERISSIATRSHTRKVKLEAVGATQRRPRGPNFNTGVKVPGISQPATLLDKHCGQDDSHRVRTRRHCPSHLSHTSTAFGSHPVLARPPPIVSYADHKKIYTTNTVESTPQQCPDLDRNLGLGTRPSTLPAMTPELSRLTRVDAATSRYLFDLLIGAAHVAGYGAHSDLTPAMPSPDQAQQSSSSRESESITPSPPTSESSTVHRPFATLKFRSSHERLRGSQPQRRSTADVPGDPLLSGATKSSIKGDIQIQSAEGERI